MNTLAELEQRREAAERRFVKWLWIYGTLAGILTISWAAMILLLTTRLINHI